MLIFVLVSYMSILKFFKPLVTPSTNKALLGLKGLLTKVLLSSTITMVNDEVSKVYQKWVLHPLNRSLEGNI